MNDQNNSMTGAPTPLDIEESRKILGSMLKDARQRSGMSLDAVAQITKISRNYVEALESGDFSKLPGAVFGRGFVASMAKVLGLSGEEVLRRYAACWNSVETLQVRKPVSGGIFQSERRWQPKINYKKLKLSGIFAGLSLPMARPSIKLTRSQSVALLVSLPVIALVIAVATASVKRRQQAKTTGQEASTAIVAVDESAAPGERLEGSLAGERTEASNPADGSNKLQNPTPAQEQTNVAVTPEEPTLEVASQRANFEHVLEMVVIEPVKVKLKLDRGQTEIRQLRPDAYRFTFSEYAEMTVYDAAAVELAFNGRSLGALGAKGRIRNLVFKSGAPEQTKVSGQIGENEKKM